MMEKLANYNKWVRQICPLVTAWPATNFWIHRRTDIYGFIENNS